MNIRELNKTEIYLINIYGLSTNQASKIYKGYNDLCNRCNHNYSLDEFLKVIIGEKYFN